VETVNSRWNKDPKECFALDVEPGKCIVLIESKDPLSNLLRNFFRKLVGSNDNPRAPYYSLKDASLPETNWPSGEL